MTLRVEIHFYIESREHELMCSGHREPQVRIPSEESGYFGHGEEWKKKRGCWVITHLINACSDYFGAEQSEQGFWIITSHGKLRILCNTVSST